MCLTGMTTPYEHAAVSISGDPKEIDKHLAEAIAHNINHGDVDVTWVWMTPDGDTWFTMLVRLPFNPDTVDPEKEENIVSQYILCCSLSQSSDAWSLHIHDISLTSHNGAKLPFPPDEKSIVPGLGPCVLDLSATLEFRDYLALLCNVTRRVSEAKELANKTRLLHMIHPCPSMLEPQRS